MSSAEVVARLVRAWDVHDADLLRSCYAPDAVVRPSGWGAAALPATEWQGSMPLFVRSFPDLRLRAEHVLEDADRVAIDLRMTGTNTGRLILGDVDRLLMRTDAAELPATGRAFDVRGVVLLELRRGLVTSEVHHWPWVDMLVQLGLLPTPAAAI